MLSGARSRQQASDNIDRLVTIYMDSATYRGLDLWQKWVYLLRNRGRFRELRFLPSELSFDPDDFSHC